MWAAPSTRSIACRWEACHSGHDAIIALLVAAGGSLVMEESELAGALCQAVLERKHGVLERWGQRAGSPSIPLLDCPAACLTSSHC
jgi:hypothetical protein